MSYVLANTSNPLGRRGLGRMGWDNAPYPVYKLSRSVARLNGDDASGAVTYRIDPRSGGYKFFRTDIKPRGVFMQNVFQHPAPPVMSALGVPVLPIGKSVSGSTLQRGPVAQSPLIAMRPGVNLSGLGCGSCSCRGKCTRLSGPRVVRRRRGMRGLGDVTDPSAPASSDIHIDPNTGCQVDSDGVILTCPIGPGGAQQPTKVSPSDPGLLQQIVNAGQQIVTTATGPRVVVQQTPSSNPFAGVPTSVLATGAVLFGALLLQGSRRR